MTTAPPANHDPALSHSPSAPQSAPAQSGQPSAPGMPVEVPAGIPMTGLGTEQVMALLKNLPGFNPMQRPGDLKDSVAAEALSNLAQAAYPHHIPHAQHGPPPHYQVHPHQPPHPHAVLSNEPGPSTHPRGPPNLGQLAATALQNPAQQQSAQQPQGAAMRTRSQDGEGAPPSENQSLPANGASPEGSSEAGDKTPGKSGAGGRRGGRSATMSNDEWARQRKDNHKEVERRRRGNINEGINELGRIVPNGSGEKAKGAILSRAVQYIHHLKENEARNIEKWTLEKLLMDQAMGDLQAQLEEMRRMWDEERIARQRLESELEVLRGLQQGLPLGAATAAAAAVAAANASKNNPPPAASGPKSAASSNVQPAEQAKDKTPEGGKESGKREREEPASKESAAPAETAAGAKRQRTE